MVLDLNKSCLVFLHILFLTNALRFTPKVIYSAGINGIGMKLFGRPDLFNQISCDMAQAIADSYARQDARKNIQRNHVECKDVEHGKFVVLLFPRQEGEPSVEMLTGLMDSYLEVIKKPFSKIISGMGAACIYSRKNNISSLVKGHSYTALSFANATSTAVKLETEFLESLPLLKASTASKIASIVATHMASNSKKGSETNKETFYGFSLGTYEARRSANIQEAKQVEENFQNIRALESLNINYKRIESFAIVSSQEYVFNSKQEKLQPTGFIHTVMAYTLKTEPFVDDEQFSNAVQFFNYGNLAKTCDMAKEMATLRLSFLMETYKYNDAPLVETAVGTITMIVRVNRFHFTVAEVVKSYIEVIEKENLRLDDVIGTGFAAKHFRKMDAYFFVMVVRIAS